jgi:hypothetical protein
MDSKGRSALCLDLFGNFAKVHTEWARSGEASGWSSSYGIGTVLVALQSALGQDHYLSQNPRDVERMARSCRLGSKCVCGHDPAAGKVYPPIAREMPRRDDASGGDAPSSGAGALPIPSRASCEVICYATKVEYNPSDNAQVFGYGVEVERKNVRGLQHG